MGKRRGRNRHRKKKQRVWERFRSHATWQTVEDDMENERYKDEQRENLKNMAELKLDLLSRTILVRNILPLGVEENQIKLRNFMESQYGPIQKMSLDKKVKRKQLPRGGVTFNFKRGAPKIAHRNQQNPPSTTDLQDTRPEPARGGPNS